MVRRKNENAPLLLNDLAPQNLAASQASLNEYDNEGFESYSLFGHQLDENQTKGVKRQLTSLKIMVLDFLLMMLEYLQYFALLQSLSLRWTWPLTWTKSMSFLFIFNLDFWELIKVNSGYYTAARDAFVASDNVPINYGVLLLGWLIALIVATAIFAFLRWRLTQHLKFSGYNVLMHVLIVAVQVLALPVGVQISKIFWCLPSTDTMDVANSTICWQGEHILYAVLGLIVTIIVFIVYPIWLIYVIRLEVISSNTRKHETYLQLKYFEYVYDLDASWINRQFLSFASFVRVWVYWRPINHFFKLLILVFYAGFFFDRLIQAAMIFALFVVMLVASMIRLPYRVTSFNFPLLWCMLCLCCNSVIGAMQNIPEIQTAFLLPSYIEGELILINVAWLVGMVLFAVYFALRYTRVICGSKPLWPMILKKGDGSNRNTKRYMIAAINGRKCLKQALYCPALLAPVHQLAHHIQVVNALAREAEYIGNPLHSTLRDVLDDLIDLHSKLVPHSIFTQSLKKNVQTTINNLTEVLPAFTKRLYQRDFDLILVPRVRRRLLLKMFAVSCFMRGHQQQNPHEPGIRKLWTAPDAHRFVFDEGFHEETEEESVINVDNIEINEADARLTISQNSFDPYTYPADEPGPSTTDV